MLEDFETQMLRPHQFVEAALENHDVRGHLDPVLEKQSYSLCEVVASIGSYWVGVVYLTMQVRGRSFIR